MRRWAASFVCLTTACATTTAGRLTEADGYLARGRLDSAERAYASARSSARDHEPWVEARIDVGLRKIELERMRIQQPWRDLTGAPLELAGKLLAMREQVRALGGDAALDAELVRVTRGLLDTVIATVEAQAGAQPATAARTARAAQRIPDATEAQATALAAVVAGAQATFTTRIDERYPLSARLNAALAAEFGGPGAEASEAHLPFVTGRAISLTGVPCLALEPFARARTTSGGRTVKVELHLTSCAATSEPWVTTTETRTWSERVQVGTRPVTRSEQVCGPVADQAIYTCTGSPPTCSYSHTTQRLSCSSVEVVVDEPIYEEVARVNTRELRTRDGTLDVAGTWVMRYGGTERRGEFAQRHGRQRVGAIGSAVGIGANGFAAIQEDASDEARVIAATALALDDVWAREGTALLDGDVQRARAAMQAAAAAGDVQGANDLGVVVALVGGPPPGIWAEAFPSTTDVRAAFQALTTTGPATAAALSTARGFEVPEAPEVIEADVKDAFASLVPPLGGRFWASAGLSYDTLPDVAIRGARVGEEAALGVQGHLGGQLLGLRRAHTFGVGIVDNWHGEITAGFLLDQPESSLGSSYFRLAGSYSLAAGYRRFHTGGLFLGATAEASWSTMATGSATAAAVTPLARLELALFRRTLGLDVETQTLVGDRLTRLSLHLASRLLDDRGLRKTSYIMLQYVDRVIDATWNVPNELNTTETVDDVAQRIVLLTYGAGF